MPKEKHPQPSCVKKGSSKGTTSAVLSHEDNGLPFSRLSATAKARALDWGREQLMEDWAFRPDDFTRNIQEYVAEKHGLIADKCYFSLGHCQGDGVAFYGSLDLDPLKQAQPEVTAIFSRLRLLGVHCTLDAAIEGANSRYHHWNSMSARVQAYDYSDHEDVAGQAAEDLERFLDDFLKDVSRDAERYGYEVIDGETSDEHVQGFLEANEYRFTKNGEFVA